ncbi:MAG: TraR/DksA C4-type zinc finger protein [Alteromonadaceae bacterium]|nr:TraR/DksA C4-type zinc finger protein [Alteromonadaceae bacterium]
MDEKQFEQAQALTERLTQAGIEQSTHRPTETPLVVGGQRLCLYCEDPLPEARLAANPRAVRCVECQTDHDRREG